jgi:nucleoid-associated protein YgaU
MAPLMMDPALKTAMAFCVLLAGICAALLFRRDPAHPAQAPNTAELLSIRQRLEVLSSALPAKQAAPPAPAPQNAPSAPASSQAATVVAPSERHEAPPLPSDSYPETDHPASSRWGVSMDMVLPAAMSADETLRSHKIVDGDTLAALADRYLGSAARANEIFNANRDVLSNPELLPIGAELKIPPRGNRPGAASPDGAPLKRVLPAG